MVSPDEFECANARGVQRRKTGPVAVSARYDKRVHRVVIGLSSGIELSFLPHDAQGLEAAKPADLDVIEISPSGLGLHFPNLDADIYLPTLREGGLVVETMPWFCERGIEEIGLFEVYAAYPEKLKLPLYQRNAVWSEGRICALWDSLLRGFPLPSFLLTRGSGVSRLLGDNGVIGTVKVDEVENGYFDVLDGQQRLAAIIAGIAPDPSIRLWIDLAPPNGPHPSEDQEEWSRLPPVDNIWTADSVERFIRCVLKREYFLYGNAYRFLTDEVVPELHCEGIID